MFIVHCCLLGFLQHLATKVIKHNVRTIHTKIFQHSDNSRIHHGRTAHIKFAVFRRWVILEIVLIKHVVNEAAITFPVIFRLWLRERQMPFKVWIFLRQLFVFLCVEGFTQRASAIPEADLARRVKAIELISEMRAHRCHARTTTDQDHFGFGFLGKKVTERTKYLNLVALLQRENP